MKINISRCTTAPTNRAFFIDALGTEDLQTAKSKHEKMLDEVLSLSPDLQPCISEKNSLFKCTTLKEINQIFDAIEQLCNESISPLIFIDGHGDQQQGLSLPSGEYLNWNDLNLTLERITRAALGQSMVVASFCHSMSAIDKIPSGNLLPTPFYFGYEHRVQAGVVEEESKQIIEELLRSGRFIKSGKEIQLYSEYDHAIPAVCLVLKKFLYPQENAEIYTELSKNNLRKTLHKQLGNELGTTKGLSKAISKALNPKDFLGNFLESYMYNTERRRKLLDEILTSLN
ncbi:hypothetical protein [Alcaligenes faecalis]|uniref:hypothetical protein n=1 Tax=Alcaligenes faecalis TaxID=511 RepID=UPI002933415E|nr:hypothetical protein [Alcaligenes faecalis]MDV2114905.1 hypothetical protein [Alcaligenes faecalis]